MRLVIPPPVQGVIAAVIMWAIAKFVPALNTPFNGSLKLAIVVGAFGLAIEFAALFMFLRAKTTVSPLSPQKTESLVINGLYKYSRNPMYLGLAFLLIAYAVWLSNPLSTLVLLGFVWWITKFQIEPEEEVLREKFGNEYIEYQDRVGRWF
ncbi:MAG: isoprenylcysteine carboxylmethyltransferase family protein [Hyphomicrobiales bacterium]